ncbi:TPA: BppU family phage baseplate upper protein [Enterococcus faecium]
MAFKINESIIVIQAEATSPNRTNVVFWSHDRGTAKLRMKLVRKNGIPQSLPEGTTVPIRLMFRSATAEGGYGKHDYLATVEDPVNGIVSIVLEDNILGYVGTVEGSVYIDFPNDRSLDTAGRFTFYIKRSPIDDSTPELEDYYFNGFSQTIDKIEKILADGKLEIEKKIAESETQIDAKLKDTNDKITKANQKITEYDQNLTELRNDMKLSEAWAWSKDGTDRFTRKYPGENYAKNSRRALELSNVTNNINLLKGDVPYNFADLAGKTVTISVEIEVKNAQPQTSGVDFRIGCEASIPRASGGTFYLGVWEKLSAGQTIATKRISRTLSIPNDIVATQAPGLHLYVQANGDYFRVSKPKIEIGDTPTIYTPAPSEDYENAYPQYRGLALLPSDLPNDYSWDITPEYTEKALTNTLNLTDPQTALGLKNFKDGAQIDGVDVATVKNLGSVLQSGSGLTTIQSDKQSAFDEFSYEFERIGDRVFFHARVKTNSTTAVASHVNLLEIPLGFQFPIGWTIVGIPLSVVQWTTPQGEISALVITDSNGKQVVKFATNRVGNHYISGEWRTADSYPETK